MLRIRQVVNAPIETTLHIEGRIVSSWVSVLEDECLRLLQEPGRRLRLDLSGVMFVDDQGVLALWGLSTHGVAFVNVPTFIQALLRSHRSS